MSITPDTSTRPLPPGVTEFDLEKALAAFAAAIGEDKVASDAESLRRLPGSLPGSRLRHESPVRSRQPNEYRGRPGGRSDRQRVSHPAVAHQPRQEQRLRRSRAAGARLGDARRSGT